MTSKQVLVLLDGSSEAEEGLPHALVQARDMDAELRLLQIIPPALPISGESSERERAGWLYLISVAEHLEGQDVDVGYQVRVGALLPTLTEEATAASLLVLTTCSAGLLRHAARDVMIARVTSRAHCPVVVVTRERREPAAPGHVRSFEDDASDSRPLVQRPLGLRTVAVDRIVGSVGRSRELGPDFLPRYARHGDWRYRRILEAMDRGEELPPVELYKLGYQYYALDGNHRVAASRARGQQDIDAIVIEFLPVDDAASQRVFLERRTFEQSTGLTRIGAARPGHYPHLHELVEAHAETEGIRDLKEAARSWYHRVYLPVATQVREARLGSLFPGERTADLFVHLADSRAAEEEFMGRPLPWEEALERMMTRYRGCHRNARLRLPDLHLHLRG